MSWKRQEYVCSLNECLIEGASFSYLSFFVFPIELDDDVLDLVAPLEDVSTTVFKFPVKMNELLK